MKTPFCIRLTSARPALALAAGLLASTTLATVSPSTSAQAQTAEYDAQWGLDAIGALVAHENGYTGKGVTVGVVDSGAFILHPDLIENLSPLSLNGPTGGPIDGVDFEGHGTHVSGTIAAGRNGFGMVGVAPDAKIATYQLTNPGTTDIDPAGIDAAVARVYAHGLANGVEIYNNSWGSDIMVPSDPVAAATLRTQFETENPQMLAAFREAAAQGAVLVWANGNASFSGAALEPGLPGLFPELRASWLTVAAVGTNGTITDYSNRCGAVAMGWCLSAPGGDDDETTGGIYATANDGDYVRMSGTSMAAPHVTGAMAVAREMFPNAAATDLAQLVLATATDAGAPGIDEVYGWGLLDLENLTQTRAAETGVVFSNAAFAQARTLGRIADIGAGLAAPQGTADALPGTVTVSTHGDAPADRERRLRWWLSPMGSFAQTQASATAPSTISRGGGLMTGLDVSPSAGLRLGAGVGVTTGDTRGGGNRVEDTGLHALAYGGYAGSRFFAEGAAGVSRFETSTTRTAIAGAGGAVAWTGVSDAVDIGAWGNARIGMSFDTLAGSLQPYAQARFVHQWLGSATETGAGVFSLTAASASQTQTDLGVGVRLAGAAHAISETLEIAPNLDLGYARAVGALGDSRATTLLGAPVAAGDLGIGRDIARVSAGVTLSEQDARLSGTLAYSGEYRARAQSHALSARMNLRF
ncbi:S8 family serine peptidase [Stappia sp.]|uniref:S8 family peptidase n=1 Tax=Stappia sp. TaxID=1870903 RepID=UPI0032D90ADB